MVGVERISIRYSNENNNKEMTQLFLNDFKHSCYFVFNFKTKQFITRTFCSSRDPGDNYNDNVSLLFYILFLIKRNILQQSRRFHYCGRTQIPRLLFYFNNQNKNYNLLITSLP